MNGLGKCRQKRNALQAQPLACRPRREGARMVGSGELSMKGLKAWQRKLDVLPTLGKQHKGADCR